VSILIFLLVIGLLVLSHEFGHFIAAKKSGMRVDEFGIGFPPRLLKWKKGETQYSINLLPIGGFVKICGEDGGEKENPQSFGAKPIYKRALVLFSGVFSNFVLAWVLLSIGFMVGMPVSTSSLEGEAEVTNSQIIVLDVQKDTPAETAGLLSGDVLLGYKVVETGEEGIFESVEFVQSFIEQNKGKEIEIKYKQDGEISSSLLTPSVTPEQGKGSLGIAMDEIGILETAWYKSLWEGAKMTYNLTIGFTVGLYHFIIDLFKGVGSLDKIMGPVGIAGETGRLLGFGFVYLLGFIALFSVNLAVINLIPFPALDGGRLLFLLIEKIKGSPISDKFTIIANFIGFILLMVIMVLVTYNDILRLF
jgi:regulator of sigma E protease